MKKFKLLSLSILFILLIFGCQVRKEPEKVWDLRDKMMGLAASLVGLPYKYGGYDLEGFDCSGFVHYIYTSYGIKIPRTAKKQGQMKGKIKIKRAKAADILVFKLKRRWHTAIYDGKRQFIHSPNSRGTIRREHLNSYWRKRLKYVISIIPE
jgi:cell wall-associated NlpC family hydrolase